MLRRLPAALSLLMLGALGLRMGLPMALDLPLVALLLAALAWRRPRARRGLAGLLALGALAWLGVAWMRVQERLALGLPWHRLAAILLAVALFTAASAWGVEREDVSGA
jgi:hypothetical protein